MRITNMEKLSKRLNEILWLRNYYKEGLDEPEHVFLSSHALRSQLVILEKIETIDEILNLLGINTYESFDKSKFPLDLFEKLSSLEHSQWSRWMEYLFSKSQSNCNGSVTIPKELVDRWTRQMNTDYSDLSEKEKESDRDQAKHVMYILKYFNVQV